MGIPREFPRGSPLEVTESIRQECAIVDDVLAAFQADYPTESDAQREMDRIGRWIADLKRQEDVWLDMKTLKIQRAWHAFSTFPGDLSAHVETLTEGLIEYKSECMMEGAKTLH